MAALPATHPPLHCCPRLPRRLAGHSAAPQLPGSASRARLVRGKPLLPRHLAAARQLRPHHCLHLPQEWQWLLLWLPPSHPHPPSLKWPGTSSREQQGAGLAGSEMAWQPCNNTKQQDGPMQRAGQGMPLAAHLLHHLRELALCNSQIVLRTQAGGGQRSRLAPRREPQQCSACGAPAHASTGRPSFCAAHTWAALTACLACSQRRSAAMSLTSMLPRCLERSATVRTWRGAAPASADQARAGCGLRMAATACAPHTACAPSTCLKAEPGAVALPVCLLLRQGLL